MTFKLLSYRCNEAAATLYRNPTVDAVRKDSLRVLVKAGYAVIARDGKGVSLTAMGQAYTRWQATQ